MESKGQRKKEEKERERERKREREKEREILIPSAFKRILYKTLFAFSFRGKKFYLQYGALNIPNRILKAVNLRKDLPNKNQDKTVYSRLFERRQ